ICHPVIYARDSAQHDLELFLARAPLTAVGSSDFHGLGQMGVCRTYVFARDNSEEAILDALRAHRTVVYGRNGRAYGDPMLVHLVAEDRRLKDAATGNSRGGLLDWFSRFAGVVGLAGALVFGGRPD